MTDDHSATFQTAREERDSGLDSSHSTSVSARCVKCREVRRKETYTDTDLSRSFRHVCHTCQTATWWNVLQVLEENDPDAGRGSA